MGGGVQTCQGGRRLRCSRFLAVAWWGWVCVWHPRRVVGARTCSPWGEEGREWVAWRVFGTPGRKEGTKVGCGTKVWEVQRREN